MRRQRLIGTALMAVAMALATAPAGARDRPGTPNNVLVSGTCEPDRIGYNAYVDKPSVCISFHNTASEPVSFWMEWQLNNQNMIGNLSSVQSECWGRKDTNTSCNASTAFRVPALGTPGDRGLSRPGDPDEGIRINNAEWDSSYCFRFKAITQDGIVSDLWSAWTCTRTRPPPPIPLSAPSTPKVTLIKGSTGKGEIGGSKPWQYLIEWDSAGSGDGLLEVEEPGGDQKWYAIGRPAGDKGEFVEDGPAYVEGMQPPPRVFRLCLRTASGRKCSRSASSMPWSEFARNQSVVDRVANEKYPALNLLEPVSGAHIRMDQLRVRIDRPASGGSTVEFILAHGSQVERWRTSMDQAVAGALVPADLTKGGNGEWTVKAWVVEPREGPMSDPVTVQLDAPNSPPDLSSGGRLNGGRSAIPKFTKPGGSVLH